MNLGRRTPFVRHLGVSFLAVCCLTAFWIGSRTRAGVSINQGLTIDDHALSFGDAWDDGAFKLIIPLRNSSSRELEILGFTSSCTCVGITPNSLQLPAGQVRDLEVTLNLTRGAKNLPARRAFQATFRPIIKEEPAIQDGWIINGNVFELLTPAVAKVGFGDLVRNARWQKHLFTVKTAIAIEHLQATLDPTIGTITGLRSKANEFEFQVSLNPLLASGPFSTALTLKPDSRGKALPAKSILLDGFIHEEVEAAPSKVLFGLRTLSGTAIETISLRSLSARPFKCLGWVSDSKSIIVREHKGAKNYFDIAFGVDHRGAHTGKVIFSVRVLNGDDLYVPVELGYFGVAQGSE